MLEKTLNYKVIGVTYDIFGEPIYNGKDFIRNSKFFGIPQNRPRTYIMDFDRQRYGIEALAGIENCLPVENDWYLYEDLNELLEFHAEAKYYMASGYLDTLVRHKERQHSRGNGFGYRVVNEPGIEHPVANTIMATGGSGKERNLVYDPQENIAGLKLPQKKTPLNDKGIRVMTPREWGKLQGFINYAFLDRDGIDHFSFPEGVTTVQQYKQFGNSVSVPVVEAVFDDFIRNNKEELGW